MAATCEISGNSDMYGLGIRIGFYLQWLSSPVSAWIAEKETSSLRSANALFKTATFIGLIIETVLNHLDVVEIYIILLLGFGTQYYRLIVMLWRIVTHFNAKWDPTRFMRMPTPSKMFWFSNSHLQVAQIIFQLWFWIYKIPRTENKCQRFGFALFRIGLTSSGFRILNIILMVALLVLTVIFFALHLRQLWQRHELPRFFKARCLTRSVVADSLETDSEDEDRATQATDDSSRRDPETERTPRRILTYGGDDTEEIETGEDVFVPSLRVPSLRVTSLRGEDEYEEKQDRHHVPEEQKETLCIIETALRLASIAVVILATELTISWNRIQGVNDAKSVGQLIPIMIGAGGVGHLLLVVKRTPRRLRWLMTDITQQSEYDMTIVEERRPREAEKTSRGRVRTDCVVATT